MVIIVFDGSKIHALDLSRSLSATLWLLGRSSTTLSNTFFCFFFLPAFWLFCIFLLARCSGPGLIESP